MRFYHLLYRPFIVKEYVFNVSKTCIYCSALITSHPRRCYVVKLQVNGHLELLQNEESDPQTPVKHFFLGSIHPELGQ